MRPFSEALAEGDIPRSISQIDGLSFSLLISKDFDIGFGHLSAIAVLAIGGADDSDH